MWNRFEDKLPEMANQYWSHEILVSNNDNDYYIARLHFQDGNYKVKTASSDKELYGMKYWMAVPPVPKLF